ncbi:hypothetical protein IQ22_03558 [Pseudomonas duriflava]|uniref:Zinc-dependent peptidase n=1 Tax=Pseudomonas duriflava TaxID=459528 RepID=A0A562Q6S6_9PSED|nr:hypothetical protein IQ22_03558 [Pseudomonas duriflava]
MLKRTPVSPDLWAAVHARLPIIAGLDAANDLLLQQRSLLFLAHKRITLLGNLILDDVDRLALAAQAVFPLLSLPDQNWYRGFHEVILYPQDFASPQRYRDEVGVEHEELNELSGEAWVQGPVIMAWSGIQESGDWTGYNLVIHELMHKIDMLRGEANGLPPLHREMSVADWAFTLQSAYDDLNQRLETASEDEAPIDPYAAEHPAEFFAVCCEYFFSAPAVLDAAYPDVLCTIASFLPPGSAAQMASNNLTESRYLKPLQLLWAHQVQLDGLQARPRETPANVPACQT